jgi:hypothetical protein
VSSWRKLQLLPRQVVPFHAALEPSAQLLERCVDAQRNGAEQGEPCDALAEAEALRGQLQAVLARTARLIAALKQQRRESRALRAAMASLRRLQS